METKHEILRRNNYIDEDGFIDVIAIHKSMDEFSNQQIKNNMKTEKLQQEAINLLRKTQQVLSISTRTEMPMLLRKMSELQGDIAYHFTKNDCTEDVYSDCNAFIERINNTFLPSINQKSQPDNGPNEKECPMQNLINRLTTMYPLVSSKLDTNVDFGNKVPNIFQQYQSAFRKQGVIMNTWHGKNDTFYYTLEHKDGDVYSSQREHRYEFEQTSQMACIEKAFEMCNGKRFDSIPTTKNTENESLE